MDRWKMILKRSFLLILICIFLISCAKEKIKIETEPEIPKEETSKGVISLEELYLNAKKELGKFTSPGYKKAIKILEKILTEDCKFYKAYPSLSLAYALWAKERKELGIDNIEQWVKASFYAQKSFELYPSTESLKGMGMTVSSRNFLTQKEYEDIFRWTQAPKRKEDIEMALWYLRDLFRSSSLNYNNEASEYLKKALSENPDDYEALLLKWWLEANGYEESEDVKKVMEKMPECSLPYFEIGSAKKRMGKLDEAEYWLLEALKREPEHPRALAELGEIYMGKGEFQKGLEYFRNALSLENELPGTHFNLGFILQEMGEYEEALKHYKIACTIKTDLEEAFYQSALIYIEESNWKEAIESLSSLIELHGSFEIFGYIFRALSNLMIEEIGKAEDDCKLAIKINPNLDLPYFILGLSSFKREEWGKAKNNFLLSLKYNSNFGEARFYLGQTYLKLKNKRMAKQEFKKAMEIFISQIKEIDKKINDLKEKGWLKKVEKLSKRKEYLQKKLSECDAFLKKLS